eukprot:CAMPEP_0172589366 /NCGR_PEP_ID=MMETSP1068-20121228/8132_1 /TAXON_ID=35684 /ORGANISM="Pseudopedinella elastica, Strain CCMP716" /LENGTH=190 /DNA_ID=CAMNT_0013384957 /DNA_START=197 /DNA_END=769 /DNA_ORIENTATION=+
MNPALKSLHIEPNSSPVIRAMEAAIILALSLSWPSASNWKSAADVSSEGGSSLLTFLAGGGESHLIGHGAESFGELGAINFAIGTAKDCLDPRRRVASAIDVLDIDVVRDPFCTARAKLIEYAAKSQLSQPPWQQFIISTVPAPGTSIKSNLSASLPKTLVSSASSLSTAEGDSASATLERRERSWKVLG